MPPLLGAPHDLAPPTRRWRSWGTKLVALITFSTAAAGAAAAIASSGITCYAKAAKLATKADVAAAEKKAATASAEVDGRAKEAVAAVGARVESLSVAVTTMQTDVAVTKAQSSYTADLLYRYLAARGFGEASPPPPTHGGTSP